MPPSEILIADVMNLFAKDVVPDRSRPKETISRIKRILSWWGYRRASMRFMESIDVDEDMAGHVSDVRTATCKAYVRFVKAQRSASMDLELLRAAMNHANKELMLDRTVPVALPPKSLPRERWLTRDEAAILLRLAWRDRREQGGKEDGWATRKHIARWMLMAYYTGTRKAAILNAFHPRYRSQVHRLGCGSLVSPRRRHPDD